MTRAQDNAAAIEASASDYDADDILVDDAPIEVVCTCCARVFEGFAPTQASDCAADVHADCVIGHYGSAVADMTRLPFKDGRAPEGLRVGGQICDSCITQLLTDEILLPEPEEVPPFGDAPTVSPEEIDELFEDLLDQE